MKITDNRVKESEVTLKDLTEGDFFEIGSGKKYLVTNTNVWDDGHRPEVRETFSFSDKKRVYMPTITSVEKLDVEMVIHPCKK